MQLPSVCLAVSNVSSIIIPMDRKDSVFMDFRYKEVFPAAK